MMFEEMLKRTTRENIIEFIMHGVECVPGERPSIEEKVKDAWKSITQVIEEKISDSQESEAVLEAINAGVASIQDAHFEVGFKAGATTLFNILGK